MNQILDYDVNSNSKKPNNSDKVVRIFAIILIVFAIVLIAVVAYGMVSNKKEVKNISNQVSQANISVEVDGTDAKISVTHDTNIQKVVYSWNGSSERTENGDGKFFEKTIEVPAGDNTLHIKVIDENGNETTHDEEISSEEGVDILNPVIELSVTDEKKLKITVTDETALDFMTYRWNEGEEQEVYADEDSKKIEIEIDILKGENDLTIVAVDKSNNTTSETKNFTGLTKPEITVTLSEDGSSIDIKAEHENGIKSVEYNFNNEDKNVDIGDGTPTSIQFEQKLEVGYNRIIITVTSTDETTSTFDGECNYGDASSNSSDNESNNDSQDEDNTSEQNNNTDEDSE